MRILLSSLSKDAKLIVRNWHTILSFMILPFILILVIGFVFGSDTSSSIRIGFEDIDRSLLPDEGIVKVSVASCDDEFASQNLNACIAQQDGRVEILIDNSRTNVYAYTVSLLQQAIERENDQAAITSISAFKSDLENQLRALEQASAQIAQVDDSISEANASIFELESSLEETGRSLGEERIVLQETRAELEVLNAEYDTRAATIDGQLSGLETDLVSFDDDLVFLRSNIDPAYIDDVDDVRGEITESLDLIDELRATIETVDSSQDVVLSQIVESSDRLDELLDSFAIYQERIGSQRALVEALDATSRDLQTQLASVENGTREALGFSPSDVLRSVNARYELYYDADLRILILPMVLMMIVVFLSTVIGSLLTYEELTSPAMVRIELSAASRAVIDLSKIIVITTIVLINVLLMYVIALTLWKADFIAQLPSLIGISIPTIITFALIGAGLSYLIRRPFVLFVSATFSSMVFIVGSGILRAPELLDATRAAVVTFNPATMFLESTRLTLLGEPSLQVLGLFVWLGLGVLFLTFARVSWRRTVFRD